MSARALVAVAVAALAAFVLMRDIGGGPTPPAAAPRARPARPARSGGERPPASTRNVFEYAPRPAVDAPPRPPAPMVMDAPPVVVPPLAPPVRLVGLVRGGGTLKAALQVHGDSMTVGLGEAAGGYTVVAIDDDGVKLRAADGTTLTLAAGGS